MERVRDDLRRRLYGNHENGFVGHCQLHGTPDKDTLAFVLICSLRTALSSDIQPEVVAGCVSGRCTISAGSAELTRGGQSDAARAVGTNTRIVSKSAHIATLPVGDSNPYRPVRRTPSSWCERNGGSSVRHHTGAGWSSDHYRRPVVGLPGDALPFLNLLPVRRLPSPAVDLPSAHHCAHQPRDIVRFLERGGDVLRCPHRTTNGCVHQ